MVKRIVVDQSSINALLLRPLRNPQMLAVGGSIFAEIGLRHLIVRETACLLSPDAKRGSRVLVILCPSGTIMEELSGHELRQEALVRALRGAYRLFVPSIGIPRDWKPYHKPGRYISFHASQFHSGVSARIHLDPNPDKTRNAMVYYVGGQSTIEDNPSAFYAEFRAALKDWETALAVPAVQTPIVKLDHSLELEPTIQAEHGQGLTARQWYEIKLTKTQREFVDYPLNQSVRLKGPAGSGKTLAMVVKLILRAYGVVDEGKDLRFGYITHSLTTSDLVRELISTIDERGLLFTSASQNLISVTTLQNLANEYLAFDLRGTEPVSLDAIEGRKTQLSFLSDVLDEYRKSDWITLEQQCSDMFSMYINSYPDSKERMLFLWELMNEFACVIEPEGVRDTAERRRKYLSEDRRAWMMPLTKEADRKAVLDLYGRFKDAMRQLEVVTIDEVVSDYLRFLDSFQWNAIRRERGYDVIFVDELHLFNRQERATFSMLGRSEDTPPVVLMAYDEKQSPRDTFLGVGAGESERYDMLRIGETKKFELFETFRYTPQITRALVAIDSHFPTLDFGADWQALKVESNLPNGDIPTVKVHRTIREQIHSAIDSASAKVNKEKAGKEVALLCLNQDLFLRYSRAGEFVDKFVVLQSREDITRLVHAKRRFVISTPEQVAGLQFAHVVIVDANEDEAPSMLGMASVKRKFVSMLYLGMSRARLSLEIHATEERGGLHEILKRCLVAASGAFRSG